MNAPLTPNAPVAKRNRGMLILLFAIFFGSLALAGVLRFAGWKPAGLKAKGNLLTPAIDARALAPVSTDGKPYVWNPVERRWRLLVLAPADTCNERCEQVAVDVDKVWQIMGKDATRVDVLWSGAVPSKTPVHQIHAIAADDRLRSVLPSTNRVATAAGLPIYIIDPNGFVMMEYKPGVDIGDVRTDLSKVLKLQ